MSHVNARVDGTRGWPGVFRPLRHDVADDGWRVLVDGRLVWFAECGCPCWTADMYPMVELPWCRECWRVRRRR